jgi:hypothetical protein
MVYKQPNRKPDLSPKWFWDFDYDQIDWLASYKTIIVRIIERGNEKEWIELIHFYGRDKVLDTLKNEILFLPDYAIDAVATYFSIAKREMVCYTRKQSRLGNWI